MPDIERCIDLVLPEASVVNARFPAACGMRFTTAMRIHDLSWVRRRRHCRARCWRAAAIPWDLLYFDLGIGSCRARGGGEPGAGRLGRRAGSGRDFGHRLLGGVPAQRAGGDIGIRGAGAGARLRPGAGFRRPRAVSWRVWCDLRTRGAASQRGGGDARQGPVPLWSWGVFGGGGGRVAAIPGGVAMSCTISASARYTGRNRVSGFSCGAGVAAVSAIRWNANRTRWCATLSGVGVGGRARDVYGVVLTGGAVDETATADRRQALRAAGALSGRMISGRGAARGNACTEWPPS